MIWLNPIKEGDFPFVRLFNISSDSERFRMILGHSSRKKDSIN